MEVTKRLSIIIPSYNAEPYIYELLDRLAPQITNQVEVIVVDDGSKVPVKYSDKRIKVIRKKNGGVSSARNVGLDNASGEYIAFIDADDMVVVDYVETILQKIEVEQFDYCYLSWQTFGTGWNCKVILNSVNDKFPSFNRCVWNRIYKRDMIGDIRFNERKAIAEDAAFIRDVKEDGKKKAYIGRAVYLYRTGHGGNLSARFATGELEFERFVYYYNHVTEDMKWLLEEAAEKNKNGEVIVMTNKNDLPELEDFALVLKPQRLIGTEYKGESSDYFIQIPKPIREQIILYIGSSQKVGGIETFLYNFCKEMSELYDIAVVYSDHMDARHIVRLADYVPVFRNPSNRAVICDTIVMMRITDHVPDNIKYSKKVQMCHTCQMKENYQIIKGWDDLVFVSDVAAKSFEYQVGTDYSVIHNFTDSDKPRKCLLLVSATRLTYEKGEERMAKLAEALLRENIPFVWMVFSPVPLQRNIPNVVRCEPTLDVRSFIERADYVVQLSDQESFCYTIVEAMELGTAVITTPLPVLDEIGFVDGKHGYKVPFDMTGIDINKIYTEIPSFEPRKSQNTSIKRQWKKVLGNSKPTHSYKKDESFIKVVVVQDYGDLELKRNMVAGEVAVMRRDRAIMLINRGFVEKYL